MGAMACQITSLFIAYLTVYFRRRSKKAIKLRVTVLCVGIHRWIPGTNGRGHRKCFHWMMSSCRIPNRLFFSCCPAVILSVIGDYITSRWLYQRLTFDNFISAYTLGELWWAKHYPPVLDGPENPVQIQEPNSGATGEVGPQWLRNIPSLLF